MGFIFPWYPTNDAVTIAITGIKSKGELFIYDLTGRLMQQTHLKPEENDAVTIAFVGIKSKGELFIYDLTSRLMQQTHLKQEEKAIKVHTGSANPFV